MNMRRSTVMLSVAVLALGANAHAEEPSRVPPEIAICSAIDTNSERLACFDEAVMRLESGHAAGAAKPPRSAEDMFGITASTPKPAKERKTERAQVEAIAAKITKLRQANDGVIMELDNGQTWRQVSGSATLLLKEGDEVRITRGALSSFNLKTPTGRIAKVRRVQ